MTALRSVTPIRIRPSSLSTWPDCTRRGYARIQPQVLARFGFKLNGGTAPIGGPIGTATHAACGHTMQHKIDHGVLANGTETEQIGLAALKVEIDKGVRWDTVSPNLNTAEKQVIRQYKSYRMHLADKIQPRIVEKRIEIETSAGNILSGAPDLTDDGVHDLKTGTAQRINVAQYGAYAALVEVETGEPVTHVTEDYIRRVAIAKEQPAPVQISYDVHFAKTVAASIIEDIERKHVQFTAAADAEGEHRAKFIFLANPSSQLCSDRYCPAFHTTWCPESFGKPKADQ